MNIRSAEVELAKVSALSVRAIRAHVAHPRDKEIVAFTPAHEAAIESTCRAAFAWAKSRQGTVLDQSFRAPHPYLWKLIEPATYLLGRRELPPTKGNSVTTIYTPQFESEAPMNWTLSTEVIGWFGQSDAREVAILTPPLTSREMEIPDSYLASLMARHINVIQV